MAPTTILNKIQGVGHGGGVQVAAGTPTSSTWSGS